MPADIDDAALGQQPRPRLGISRILEQNQLHGALPRSSSRAKRRNLLPA
jgi:hypothetical protein